MSKSIYPRRSCSKEMVKNPSLKLRHLPMLLKNSLKHDHFIAVTTIMTTPFPHLLSFPNIYVTVYVLHISVAISKKPIKSECDYVPIKLTVGNQANYFYI